MEAAEARMKELHVHSWDEGWKADKRSNLQREKV